MVVIKPRSAQWDFAARERELFSSAAQIPTWRLGNQSRRMLADVIRQLTEQIPTLTEPLQVDELDPILARQLATVQLASIVVRCVGAQLVLVSCGYEREALGQIRTQLEAVLRTRQVHDDQSGDVARSILKGQRPRSLKAIAARYGNAHDIELLDHFAHADIRTLMPLSDRVKRRRTDPESVLELRPTRGQLRPAQQLYETAYTATSAAVVACEVFEMGLEVPRWISGQLKRYRDNSLPVPL